MQSTAALALPKWRYAAEFSRLEAKSAFFPIAFFAALVVNKLIHIPGVAGYDLLFLFCLLLQGVMVAVGMETLREVLTVGSFHLLGLALEVFKVRHGSWSYPEPSALRIADVPLYSGFMYASIGSYVCQAYRNFKLTPLNWPKWWVSFPVAGAAYINFFTHHILPDFRWSILAVMVVAFRRCSFEFSLHDRRFVMPSWMAFTFIGLFVWFSENFCTFFGAWRYPYQKDVWHVVDLGKLTSWVLLVMLSVIIVVQLKLSKQQPQVS